MKRIKRLHSHSAKATANMFFTMLRRLVSWNSGFRQGSDLLARNETTPHEMNMLVATCTWNDSTKEVSPYEKYFGAQLASRNTWLQCPVQKLRKSWRTFRWHYLVKQPHHSWFCFPCLPQKSLLKGPYTAWPHVNKFGDLIRHILTFSCTDEQAYAVLAFPLKSLNTFCTIHAVPGTKSRHAGNCTLHRPLAWGWCTI